MNDVRGMNRPPLFVVAVTLVAVLSLRLGVVNAVAIGRQADQRNQDRIASDVAGCERGNVFRQQVIDLGHATDQLVSSILDLTFRSDDPARQAAIEAYRQLLAPLFSDFRQVVGSIRIIDCALEIPGAALEETP